MIHSLKSIIVLFILLTFFSNAPVFALGIDIPAKHIALKDKSNLSRACRLDSIQMGDLLGNWYNKKSKNWTFGFFENFAIYDDKFWEYESHLSMGKSHNIILKNGTDKISLLIAVQRDSLISVKTDNGPVVKFKKVGLELPTFNTFDHSKFINSHYSKIDTAYLSGYIKNLKNSAQVVVTLRNVLSNQGDTFFGNVDTLGRFFVKLPLLNTSEIYLQIGGQVIMTVVEPGERYLSFYDMLSRQKLFMGKKSRIQNELARYNPNGIDAGLNIQTEETRANELLNGLDYLNVKRALLNKANSYSEQYFRKNPKLSDKAIYYIRNYNRYSIGFALMQKRFDLDIRNKERFPEAYMKFVSDTLVIDPIISLSLNANFPTFMNDYVDYLRDGLSISGASHNEALKILIDKGLIKVTDEEKKAVELLLDIENSTESNEERTKLFKQQVSDEQSKLVRDLQIFHQEKITDVANELLWRNLLVFDANFYKKTIANEDIRDVFQARNLFQYFERTRKPMAKDDFEKYLEIVISPVFKKVIKDYNDHLLKAVNTDFIFAQSLKNTENYQHSKDADSLFKELTSPYKGKIIYVDFWGTWCGPCREELKHVGLAKETLKYENVIFMYFANNSPEETWKNMIKELGLTSENTVHYRLPQDQELMIEKRFSISRFPTYMLIDQEGNVRTMDAPRPSDPQGLLQAVRKL